MKKLVLLATVLGLIAATSAYAAEAKDNWTKHCAMCHGADGKGKAAMKTKDYTSAAVHSALTDDAAFKAIKEGFKPEKGPAMKPYAEKMSDAEIKALVAYMRSLKQ